MGKWMVYDTRSQEVVFYETEEDAMKDYDGSIAGLVRQSDNGHKVYLFEVKKESEIFNSRF